MIHPKIGKHKRKKALPQENLQGKWVWFLNTTIYAFNVKKCLIEAI